MLDPIAGFRSAIMTTMHNTEVTPATKTSR
jgi:hypothetical protein